MKINLKSSLMILFIVVAFMVIMPNMVNGATTINATETSTTSTGKTVSWTYSLNSNNEIQDLVCSNVDSISGTITIPKTIDGHKVIGLGYNAFKNCYGLTGITFNANITSINKYAFNKCTGIQSIDLSTSNVTKINDFTFEDCYGIKTLNLGQNITSIGNRCFFKLYWSNFSCLT